MKTKTLLVCGVIGGPLFVVALLVEGATRANYEAVVMSSGSSYLRYQVRFWVVDKC